MANLIGDIHMSDVIGQTTSQESTADHELLDLFRRWKENEAAFNARGLDYTDDEATAFAKRASDLEWKIVKTPATSIQGLVVKLAVACHSECTLTFGEGDAPGHAVLSALQDARLIAGLAGAA